MSKDDTLEPAIEIVVQGKPRDIERSTEDILLFKDLRPYLQIGRNFSVVNRLGWSNEAYEYKSEIPEKYNDTILVEHEDEVNRKLEEQNEISFRKIFEYMREDITLSLELKHQYDLVIKSANQYNFYRNMILGEENMEAINKKRKFYQDIFIDMLDQYADSIEEETAHKVAWRVALGSDKQKLGDFAEYISHVTFIRKDML